MMSLGSFVEKSVETAASGVSFADTVEACVPMRGGNDAGVVVRRDVETHDWCPTCPEEARGDLGAAVVAGG